MATPRSPYVCIGDALLDEPWPPEVKLTLVLLSCHMHVRWRNDRRLTLADVASSHPVGVEDAMKITGRRRTDIAWKSLERLADFASMSVRLPRNVGGDVDGTFALISWPKWAEYNKAVTRQSVASGAPESPSASASASASERSTPTGEVGAAAPATGETDPEPADPLRGLDCDRLSPARIRKLVEMRPKGITYTETQVGCWYAVKAPKMRAAGKRNLWQTARNWWERVRHEEVVDAERAVRNRRLLERRNGSALEEGELEPVHDPETQAAVDALFAEGEP